MTARESEEYKEYSTPEVAAKNWYNEPSLPCHICGMSDEPIVVWWLNGNRPVCRWCAELHYLTLHLQNHGNRDRERQQDAKMSSEKFVAMMLMMVSLLMILIDQIRR